MDSWQLKLKFTSFAVSTKYDEQLFIDFGFSYTSLVIYGIGNTVENEKANQLDWKGVFTPFMGAELFCGIKAVNIIRGIVRDNEMEVGL